MNFLEGADVFIKELCAVRGVGWGGGKDPGHYWKLSKNQSSHLVYLNIWIK